MIFNPISICGNGAKIINLLEEDDESNEQDNEPSSMDSIESIYEPWHDEIERQAIFKERFE